MLSLIRHLSFQEASSVKAEINEGLWQVSCTSSAACPVKKNISLQMIYVMSKESDFKMCPILDICGFLADQLIVQEATLGFEVAYLYFYSSILMGFF